MKKTEQAEPGRMVRQNRKQSRYHSFLKREGRRIMRRLGKLLLDDAPRKLFFRGYEW